MSTVNDAIGVWNDLGTIVPVVGSWLKFPNLASGGNDTIRLTFDYPNTAKVSSWGWLRPVYATSAGDIVGQSTKIYPKQERMAIEFPIPGDFRDRGVIFRNFEVLKIRKSVYVGVVTDYEWGLKLEELWG